MKRFSVLFFILVLHECVNARLPDLIPYRKGNLWGYCDSTKKMIIEPKYYYANAFDGNTATAFTKDENFIIDKQGNEIKVNDSVYRVHPKCCDGLRIFYDQNSKSGLINEKGEIVMTAIPYYLDWLNGDYLLARDIGNYRPVAIFNIHGKKLVDLSVYHEVDDFDDDLAGKFVCQNQKKKFGMIDTNGVVVIPFRYKKLYHLDIDGSVFLTRDSVFCYDQNCRPYKFMKKEKFGRSNYVTYDLPAVVDTTNRYIHLTHQDYSSFCEHKKYGYKNEEGKIVIEAKYNDVEGFFVDDLTCVNSTGNIRSKNYRFLGYVDIYGTEYWEE